MIGCNHVCSMNQLPEATDRYWCSVFQQTAPGARHRADSTLHTIPLRFITGMESRLLPPNHLETYETPNLLGESYGNRDSFLLVLTTSFRSISVTYLVE
ncbi:hypothetical protein Zmor_013796 [Zophobas morio]|uniref:Uncharacterized protein n=1 Tax=Zophobas morio TaxID=2755281 RepID=A0AA38MG18_9CUCU|nr:hypothetical protein Zmor_013796 [Zophobas morio]